MTRFSMTLELNILSDAAELHTLSIIYPLCGSSLTDATDSLSEMCPDVLTDIHSHPEKIPFSPCLS